MSHETDVMNAVEAAAFLGIHVETLRRFARKNVIPSFKIGRDWRFRKEALLHWADTQRQAGSDAPVLLVVDGDPDHCLALAQDAARLGYRTLQAISSRSGLDLVLRESPSLVILGMGRPSLPGPEFLEALRKTHPVLPVVVVTGPNDRQLMLEAASHAPIMLLTRPVQPELLRRTVESVVGGQPQDRPAR